MIKTSFIAFGLMVSTAAIPTAARASEPKSYQMTAPVVEVKDDVIVVQKGRDKVEVARNSETKITGALEVGSVVTVTYRMVADGVEVKPTPQRDGQRNGKNVARWEAADKPSTAK